MAKRIYFHVGAPKTGTTFIQGIMWHHRAEMAEAGVLFPGRTPRDHLHASQVVREVPQGKAHTAVWDDLVAELAAWPGTGVLSHEFFGMATPAQARAALARLAPAEVHVVLTARDFVRQFAADWQESLKMNLNLSLDRFLARAEEGKLPRPWGWQSHDIVQVLANWGGGLPPERVHVITVPPPGAPRDLLWRRWSEVVGLDPDAYDLDIAFPNQSLGVVQAELLRKLKPALTEPLTNSRNKHRWVRGYFAHEVLLQHKGARFTLRQDQIDQLTVRARSAVDAITTAGYDVVGDLADLIPQATDPSLRHPSDVTDAEMLDVAVVAMEQMIQDVRRLTETNRRLSEQVANTSGSTLRRGLRRLRRSGSTPPDSAGDNSAGENNAGENSAGGADE